MCQKEASFPQLNEIATIAPQASLSIKQKVYLSGVLFLGISDVKEEKEAELGQTGASPGCPDCRIGIK